LTTYNAILGAATDLTVAMTAIIGIMLVLSVAAIPKRALMLAAALTNASAGSLVTSLLTLMIIQDTAMRELVLAQHRLSGLVQ
jgi:hypothetical protein